MTRRLINNINSKEKPQDIYDKKKIILKKLTVLQFFLCVITSKKTKKSYHQLIKGNTHTQTNLIN